MADDKVVAMIVSTAFRANERVEFRFSFYWTFGRSLLLLLFMLQVFFLLEFLFLVRPLLVNQLCDHLGLLVVVYPNAADFHQRAELGPFQLVQQVVHFVGALDEIGMRRVDCELDFAGNQVVKLGVDHDVVGSLSESVLGPNDPKPVRLLIVDPFELFVNFEDLFFFGRIFASKKVEDLKSYQIKVL